MKLMPKTMGDVEELIKKIDKLYDEADAFSREVAEFRDEAAIPAHNELRYAGHHFIQATVADDDEKKLTALTKARGHCERAMYEASEAGIQHAVLAILDFRSEYRSLVISQFIPEFNRFLAAARTEQKRLAEGRNHRESIEAQTREYMERFRFLRDAVETMEAARDDLNVAVTERTEKQHADRVATIREDRRFMLRVMLTIFGIIVSIILALLV